MKGVSRATVALFVLLSLVLPVTQSVAWSRTGHMIVGAMAYRLLPADLKIAYTEILQHHPDYETWKKDYDALTVDIEPGEYYFMQASFWPDVIRRTESVYDHPTWHYTNLPVRPGVFTGEITEVEPTITPDNDVIFGYEESLRILFDESKSMEERAAHLSWVIHLVGDIHQPLHSVALVSDVYPEGDRGGNLIFVRPTAEAQGINLHAFWDSLLGRSSDTRNARNETTRLMFGADSTLWSPENDQTLIMDWAIESRALAIDYVYLRGELIGVTPERRDIAPVLPDDYARNAKSVAEKRVVVAGHRLARVISRSEG